MVHCLFPIRDYNHMRKLRAWWEEWDLRILILYILIAQLYLHFFGRHRRRNKSALKTIVSVWLLYLFSDLLATIALGKLSKINVDNIYKLIKTKGPGNYTMGTGNYTMGTGHYTNGTGNYTMGAGNYTMGTGNYTNGTSNYTRTISEQSLRVVWAPLILFYLGGPDTITVLRVEENELWVRHLIGLLTQGLRTAFALVVTWNSHDDLGLPKTKGSHDDPGLPKKKNPHDLVLSLLPLLLFIPGIIKYGERVWVVRSRSKLQLPKIDKIRASRPNTEIVLLAYSWIQTLMPHQTSYKCNASEVKNLVTSFRESVNTVSFDAFKLIEIELGFIYDILFSKVGTIFTVWRSILRFLSFSLIVSVLVMYIKCDKPPGHVEGDHIITIIVLAGAIFLEAAGIFVQLVSDWAVVWACQNGSKWATSVLFLDDFLISKSQRWSGVMGQFSLREFYRNYKHTVCNRTWECLFGWEKMLKRFSTQKSLDQHLKDLIIRHLREKLGGGAVVVEQQFKRSIEEEFEFGQSIVIWHVATEVCYESDYPKFYGEEVKLKKAKILSDYMMYLLVVCPDRFPFCIEHVKLMEDYAEMKIVFQGVLPEGDKNEGDTTYIKLAKNAQRLVQDMKGHPESERWDILGNMWVEMLCYAAMKCPVKNHIQELRHGGEFLTHVWLLLFHFGITKKQERSTSSRKDEYDGGVKKICGCLGGVEGD